MQDLWAAKRESALKGVEPLAVRMRPRTFEAFAGQAHIVGSAGDGTPTLLRRMIAAGRRHSHLLHGPPGTGETPLPQLLPRHPGRATVLILDEIHRFSRTQQDALLEDVERGIVTLIGVTTENPLFAVNAALVSRSTLFRLEQLKAEDVADVVRRAITDEARGFGKLNLRVDDDAVAPPP